MACEESFEIIPNKKAKSSVCNHFGFLKENDGPVNKTRVACKLCPVKRILKYSGNTKKPGLDLARCRNLTTDVTENRMTLT